MEWVRALVAATAVLLATSACSEDSESQNWAAQSPEQQEALIMNAMMNDPNNPYAPVEIRMNERMRAAVGVNASESWVRKMIEHHRGGIEMTKIFLAQGGDAKVLQRARKDLHEQSEEIPQLERLRQGLGASWSGGADDFVRAERQMHDRMMAASEKDAAGTWMRKMIEHHRGAVDLSNILLARGGEPKVFEKARLTAQKHQQKIEELQGMLDAKQAATNPTGTNPADPTSKLTRPAAR